MNNLPMWLRYQWDRAAAITSVVAGAIALLLGWLGASGTVHPAEQIPYVISGGLTGIFLLGLGVMLWLSADLRDTWRKLNDLLAGQELAVEPSVNVRAGAPDAEPLEDSAVPLRQRRAAR